MNILELEHVSVAYGKGKPAVEDVSFSVPEKSIVAIVGESGSGKSSLLRAVMGLLPSGGEVSGGTIRFEGRDLDSLTRQQRRQIRGKDMAMIFQNAGEYLNPRRKVGAQYLETLGCHLDLPRTELKKLALDMLAALKLTDGERIMNSYPFQLSGGMKQRAAIAMAMSLNPRLLLADEPTSALDVTTQAQVVQELIQARDRMGMAIVAVTHNMGAASRIADYIVVMQNGTIKEHGTRDQVIQAPASGYTKQLLAAAPALK